MWEHKVGVVALAAMLAVMLVVIQIIFLTLKMTSTISWSWWVVIGPMYPVAAVALVFGLIYLILRATGAGVQ